MGATMKRVMTAALAATAALSLAAPAQAAVTIKNFKVAGAVGSGTFSLAFDNLTSTYSLSALNFTVVGASTTFDTSNSGVAVIAPNVLEIGGTVYGVGNFAGEIANPVDDFAFEFDPTLVFQSGQLNYLSYALGNPPTPGGIAYSSVPETITAVPEPSTWAMFLLGFGAMGIAIGRKKQAQSQLACST